MSELTMNTMIHAAFRRDLGRFKNGLGTFPIGSQARADQLFAAWQNFSHQVHLHHRDEETIFWPVLAQLGAGKALVSDLEGEHARMANALEAAEGAMVSFHADPDQANMAAAGAAMRQLDDVVNEHLAHEERDMEPISKTQHSTPPMKAAQKAVRKAHKGNTGTFMAWLLDGDDPDVKSGLRREIPPPVLFVINQTGGRGYRRRIAPVWS